MHVPTDRSHGHDENFHQFDDTHDSGLVKLVGDLTRCCRQQQKRENEQARDQIIQQTCTDIRPVQGIKGDHGDQCGLEQIIVEGSQELSAEERCETPLPQQRKLIGHLLQTFGVVLCRPVADVGLEQCVLEILRLED